MQVHIYDQAANVESVAPNLWAITDVFSQTEMDFLRGLNMWQPGFERNETWIHDDSCTSCRLLLAKNSASFGHVQNMGEPMRSALSTICGTELRFSTSKVWLDIGGSNFVAHVDDPNICVTMQVYVWSYGSVSGTRFLHVDPAIQFPFTPNTGYINLNSDLKRHDVPESSGTRLSVAWHYARADQ